MADATPNYKVEQQRIKFKIAGQVQAIERAKLDVMELGERKRLALESMASAQKAIDDLEKQLKGLEETHGELKDADFKKMADSV